MTEAEAQAQTTEEVLEEARAERERLSGELREISTKLEQSRGELELNSVCLGCEVRWTSCKPTRAV